MCPCQAEVTYEFKLYRSKIKALNFFDTAVILLIEFIILLQTV